MLTGSGQQPRNSRGRMRMQKNSKSAKNSSSKNQDPQNTNSSNGHSNKPGSIDGNEASDSGGFKIDQSAKELITLAKSEKMSRMPSTTLFP